MADEQKTTPKKPPAHEVILKMLRGLAKDHEQGVHLANIAPMMHKADVLLDVLRLMHIPERERLKVRDALLMYPSGLCTTLDCTIREVERGA